MSQGERAAGSCCRRGGRTADVVSGVGAARGVVRLVGRGWLRGGARTGPAPRPGRRARSIGPRVGPGMTDAPMTRLRVRGHLPLVAEQVEANKPRRRYRPQPGEPGLLIHTVT